MKKRNILLVTGVIFCSLVSLSIFNNKFESYTKVPKVEESVSENKNNSNSTSYNAEDTKVTEEVEDEKIVEAGYEDIEEYLDQEAANKSFQGVALVAKGDEIRFAKAYGYADEEDGRKNTLQTRFSIASNTKQFTATAIMQLIDDGKIDLSQTIDKFFPEYKYSSQITIKDLIQMRSGIPCYLNEIDLFMKDPDTLSMLKEYEGRKYFDAYVEDKRWTSELILRNLYLTDLKFEPNTAYDYSNTNYYLLGLIIEKASGISYEEYIKENIFKATGMTNASMVMEKLDAKGHGSKESGEIAANPKFTYSAGNIHANVYDLLKWNRELHRGNIISNEAYNQMVTPVDKYGYGLFIKDGLISHSGVIDGFVSNTEYNPTTDTTIIILENYGVTTELLDPKYDTSIIRGLMAEN